MKNVLNDQPGFSLVFELQHKLMPSENKAWHFKAPRYLKKKILLIEYQLFLAIHCTFALSFIESQLGVFIVSRALPLIMERPAILAHSQDWPFSSTHSSVDYFNAVVIAWILFSFARFTNCCSIYFIQAYSWNKSHISKVFIRNLAII